jgi:protoporphyrinogen oxidase
VHNHNRIQAIEINGNNGIETDEIVSTLPLNLFVQMLEPIPPKEILCLAKSLSFRNLILVVILIDRKSITKSASVYFPDQEFPFTRIYEPKNRSTYMSPPEKTSLVAEIPCSQNDEFWNMKNDELIQSVYSSLIQIGWIKQDEIIGASVKKLNYAYPMLEKNFEAKLKKINAYLKHFQNLKFSGRSGKFVYTHIHDIMKFGKEITDEYIF